MKRVMDRTPPWVVITIIAFFVLSAPFVVYFTSKAVVTIDVRPAPIRYLAKPPPLQRPVCPGDTIRYTFRFEITEAVLPVALTVERGIWSADEGRFVVGSKEPTTYPYNRSAVIERTSAYTIPDEMDDRKPFPPGQYVLMVTGESEMRSTVGFQIPFEIGAGCKS